MMRNFLLLEVRESAGVFTRTYYTHDAQDEGDGERKERERERRGKERMRYGTDGEKGGPDILVAAAKVAHCRGGIMAPSLSGGCRSGGGPSVAAPAAAAARRRIRQLTRLKGPLAGWFTRVVSQTSRRRAILSRMNSLSPLKVVKK